MKVAIVCYPTYGGSGVVATELGLALAERDHEVHFLSYEPPYRLGGDFRPNVFFHEVQVTAYPLFRYPPYDLALASKLVEVAETHGIDLIHAHYAVPHAVSAVLARDMLGRPVKVLTTLHGTDVTLVGQEKSYLAATRYGLMRSDGITAVSRHLAEETKRVLCDTCKVRVVYNFVDTERYAPRPCGPTRARFAKPEEKVLLHVSNFRPVKRPLDVVAIFAEVARAMPAKLLLVGEGPELQRAEEFAAGLGLANRVRSLGQRSDIERILPCADLFLLPSQSESFGLAALEAMSCGVPAVASRVGGLPEVIEDGVSGILAPVGATEEMAARAVRLLENPKAHEAMAKAARQRATDRFDRSLWIGEYESVYRQLLAGA